ncbi:hypothetical protein WEU32_10060 [Brevundimonas sp. BH3]|uniref:hypothetical protein n=1 Tax=Brevundimonas sp. BH3 TaxID=3133089 RepID=UPI003249307B
MLHAFNIKNARRVLQPKASEHSIEKSEDAATSMVFTPLTFMTPGEALDSLEAFLGDAASLPIAGRGPIRHTVDLWPGGLLARSADGDHLTRCEPDLMITFEFEQGPSVIFIGEMKWGWSMPAADLRIELDREIEAIRRHDPHAVQVVFVISQYAYGPMNQVTLLTWKRFSSLLRPLAHRAPVTAASRWADLVCTFLERADQWGFAGIPQTYPLEAWSRHVAFWRP